MDACIFILTINALISVYAADRATEISSLGIGDKVCVMEIENGDWMKIHWSNGNVGHTGFIHEIGVKKPGVPSEPMPYEQNDTPPPAPTIPDEPVTPQNHSLYDHGPTPPATRTLPAALVMKCFPEHSQPYAVMYTNGKSAIGTKNGKTRDHEVLEVLNNQQNHVFYVKAEGSGGHTLFYAFDYSQIGNDASAIRVIGKGYDAKDKCAMDWTYTK